jgi:hypothetical protein
VSEDLPLYECSRPPFPGNQMANSRESGTELCVSSNNGVIFSRNSVIYSGKTGEPGMKRLPMTSALQDPVAADGSGKGIYRQKMDMAGFSYRGPAGILPARYNQPAEIFKNFAGFSPGISRNFSRKSSRKFSMKFSPATFFPGPPTPSASQRMPRRELLPADHCIP